MSSNFFESPNVHNRCLWEQNCPKTCADRFCCLQSQYDFCLQLLHVCEDGVWSPFISSLPWSRFVFVCAVYILHSPRCTCFRMHGTLKVLQLQVHSSFGHKVGEKCLVQIWRDQQQPGVPLFSLPSILNGLTAFAWGTPFSSFDLGGRSEKQVSDEGWCGPCSLASWTSSPPCMCMCGRSLRRPLEHNSLRRWAGE